MAAAARPGSPDARDARLPCPLCGGLIHPIAGKCKHCKADLTAYRAARPAANAPLPALNGASHGVNGASPNGLHAPVAHAVPPPAHDVARLVLPPRPTGHAQTMSSSSGAWGSWPILVIVVAVLAIVAAVVLMMWPASHDRDGKRVLQPPPAPERMDTQTPPVVPKADPSPSQPGKPTQGASRDPWAPAPDPAPDPSAQAGAQAGSADSNDDTDLDLINPFDSSRPSPSRGRHGLSLNAGGRLAIAMTAHLCRRLTDCGINDGALGAPMHATCEAIARWPQVPPSSCPAAVRCLQAIDTLSCTASSDDLQLGALLTRLSDCTDAMQC